MKIEEKYLQATEFFDFGRMKVKSKALEITENLDNKTEKIKQSFY
jgi:hypothetical protein